MWHSIFYPDQDAGIKLVLKAIEAPLREIVYNAGGEPSVVVNAILAGKGNDGFNAANDTYGDMNPALLMALRGGSIAIA